MTITEPGVTSEEQRSSTWSTTCSRRSRRTRPTPRCSSARSSTGAWPGSTSRRATAASGVARSSRRSINERIYAAGGPEPVLPQPDRLRHVRADGRGVGQRGAEEALPAPAVHRRGDLVPAVLRAGLRLRLRRPVVAGRPRRRRVDRQRPEGVDDAGPRLPLGPARRAHRPRRAQARRPHRLRRRHAGARRRDPAAAPDDRRGRVQRGVLHRRPHPRQRAPRRRRATAGGCRSPRS